MHTAPYTDELGLDWKGFLETHSGQGRDELPLSSIVPGDRILIKTRNTHYLFVCKDAELMVFHSNSSKVPSGPVRIMGCSFGLSSSIRPDALFCGGNLEFTHSNGEKTWTTSAIREIYLFSRMELPTKSQP